MKQPRKASYRSKQQPIGLLTVRWQDVSGDSLLFHGMIGTSILKGTQIFESSSPDFVKQCLASTWNQGIKWGKEIWKLILLQNVQSGSLSDWKRPNSQIIRTLQKVVKDIKACLSKGLNNSKREPDQKMIAHTWNNTVKNSK